MSSSNNMNMFHSQEDETMRGGSQLLGPGGRDMMSTILHGILPGILGDRTVCLRPCPDSRPPALLGRADEVIQ